MIDKKRFPKLNKIQDKNLWFIHVYKDGGIGLFKSINIETDPIKENMFKFMGNDLTPDDNFFNIKIIANKLWFNPTSNVNKNMYHSTVIIRNEKGDIIPDILTKEVIEQTITEDTIVLDSKELQTLINLDCELEKFFEINVKNTFKFINV